MSKARYPKRGTFFSHKFCRLLANTSAAQEIGPEACWLLTIIVHIEDAKRYTGPVRFWNENLMAVCGFGGKARLVGARDKAIKAGWLHYARGSRGKSGEYWVKIPVEFQDFPDSPMNEEPEEFRSESERKGDSVPIQNGKHTYDSVPNQNGKTRKRSESERKPDGNRTETDPPSTLSLSLSLPAGAGDRSFRKWLSEIQPEEFASPERGMVRFLEATEGGFLHQEQRHRFIALWMNTQSKAAGGRIENPAAVFVRNLTDALKSGKWKIGTEDEDDRATAFLRDWDQKHRGGFSPEVETTAAALAEDIELPEGFDDEP